MKRRCIQSACHCENPFLLFQLLTRNPKSPKDVRVRIPLKDQEQGFDFKQKLLKDIKVGKISVETIEIDREILQDAYNSDFPAMWLEVQYYWQEFFGFPFYYPRRLFGRFFNRLIDRIEFYLVDPLEVLIKSRRLIGEILEEDLKDPELVKIYGTKVWQHRYGDNDQVPIELEINFSSSWGKTQTDLATTSYEVQQTKGKQIGSEVTSKVNIPLDFGKLIKLGEFETSVKTTSISTKSLSKKVAESVSRSEALTIGFSQYFKERIKILPAPPGMKNALYLVPEFEIYKVPIVSFDGPDHNGQATRRTELDPITVWIPKTQTITTRLLPES